ncbi:MAG TPA: MaoC family dehydratase [Acidimicrobiales bacterium]|nr:MaoC family dehydratase [Acidimicrobiales bacterium]
MHARDSRFGGYLEDYEVGDVFYHWPGKTITEAEAHLFCVLTLAVHPLHVDANYADNEMEGGRNIVVGTFVYALLLGMSVPDISGRAIANLGVERLRHLAPMHHGDTLYGMTEVTGSRVSASRPRAGILTVDTKGTNQNEVVVCEFTRSILLPRRPGTFEGDAVTSARDISGHEA